MSVENYETAITRRLIDSVDGNGVPHPVFPLRTGWAADYTSLFAGKYSREISNLEDILVQASSTGRVVLVGRGGGAKSVTLRRLAKVAITEGSLPILIKLDEWLEANYTDWSTLSGYIDRLRYLLRFTDVDLRPRDLDVLPADRSRVLLIDGLNEVNVDVAQQIIYTVDEYVRYAVNTCVIITDRLVRRELGDQTHWSIAMILPLSEGDVKQALTNSVEATKAYDEANDDERALLNSPYFLDSFIRNSRLSNNRASEMQAYFRRHALSDADLASASHAAYDAYAGASRMFDLDTFASVAGDEVTRCLITAGAILDEGKVARFDHHLKHDYLASRYVSETPDRWHAGAFDCITFRGSSFDSVEMLMELIPETLADVFIRRVYDWNIYASGYAIAEGRSIKISDPMRIVMLAMLAERRWDLLTTTAHAAEDTLRLIDNDLARSFATAATLEDVFQLVSGQTVADPWFVQWRQLFTRERASGAQDEDIATLAEEDSVLGWTTANVLKRSNCSEEQLNGVRSLLGSDIYTVRWRAVHVLGAFPSEKNLSSLVHALMDKVTSVHYDALRSLIELAARADQYLSKLAFQDISDAVPQLVIDQPILNELERAIFIRRDSAPNNWARLVAIAMVRLQEFAESSDDQEHWNRIMSRVVSTYGL